MEKGKKIGRIMWIMIIGIILGIAAELLLYHHVVVQGRRAVPVPSDLILVLGCRIHGERPSLSLQYRLEKALEIYQEGYGKRILVSGGQGPDEPMAEADLMRQYLIDGGIPSDVIITENQSTSTSENIRYSKAIMDRYGYTSVVIVTNDFHIYRSLTMAGYWGMEATGAPAPTADVMKHYYRVRETLAILKYWILRK